MASATARLPAMASGVSEMSKTIAVLLANPDGL